MGDNISEQNYNVKEEDIIKNVNYIIVSKEVKNL